MSPVFCDSTTKTVQYIFSPSTGAQLKWETILWSNHGINSRRVHKSWFLFMIVSYKNKKHDRGEYLSGNKIQDSNICTHLWATIPWNQPKLSISIVFGTGMNGIGIGIGKVVGIWTLTFLFYLWQSVVSQFICKTLLKCFKSNESI